MVGRRKHWDGVYGSKASTEVSWYQEIPDKSLVLVDRSGIKPEDAIIDIGGGASTLVDHLLDLSRSQHVFEELHRVEMQAREEWGLSELFKIPG